MNLAESLLLALKDAGAEEIFGIPGDFALPLFKVIEESGILPCFTLSHEPAVGFAADAAARIRGKPSVAAVTYGAGAFNLVNPVAAAYAEKSPVVVISGAPGVAEAASGLLIHHQAKHLKSQLEIYKEITCDQCILDDPARAPEQIARVLNRCVNESRPVYLEMPRDRVFAEAKPVDAIRQPLSVRSEALDACVAEIAERLAQSTSPVLLVGVEVRRFGLEDAVARLARKLGIPVATTFMGRGLLADTDVALRGTYLGVAGDPEVTRLVEGSDGLVMLGVITSDNNFGISRRQINLEKSVLACDGAVSLGYHVYPDLPLVDLVSALERTVPAAKALPSRAQTMPSGLVADEAAISPLDIARAVNDLDDLHFADIARILGGDGYRAVTRGELRDALAQAHATRGRFQLVEIMLPRGALSPTLDRFVTGFKKRRAGERS